MLTGNSVSIQPQISRTASRTALKSSARVWASEDSTITATR